MSSKSSIVAALATLAPLAMALPQVTSVTSMTEASASLEATTTGALSLNVQAPSVPTLPPGPDATTYPRDGQLHGDEPAPYTPSGGLGTNGSEPLYQVTSDFDFESLALGLYQEWIELDLFHHGLAQFSAQDFEDAGLTAEDRFLIEFMADQEVGHSAALSALLGPAAPVQCNYTYPFTTVREFVDFNQKLTRFGESGAYGFLNHMNSRDSAQILLQSITTEARQQMIFRQFEGLFPVPVWFETGIPQSWQWTLLAPYIATCPANQTRLAWQNFPALNVLNDPNAYRANPNMTGTNETISSLSGNDINNNSAPAITHNRTIPLSYPGKEVFFSWELPGKAVGPNGSYVTNTTAGTPSFVAWVSQLNVTYSALTNVSGNTGMTLQPNVSTFAGDPAINGTMFVALTDANVTLTPFNISMINPHVVAGPALYQAG